MVKGLEKFKEYFNAFTGNYIIIGGTACDIIIGAAGLIPRVTKDIDIILIIENVNPEFIGKFWEFIKDGKYENLEKSAEERKYYRFLKPDAIGFPYQVELFSRKPDVLELEGAPYLTPIPVDIDLSSLSAILLNDDYYHFTLEHSIFENGLHWANIEALICLKAKAFLEMKERKERGERVDERHIKKHKADLFRLVLLLSPQSIFDLPDSIKSDLQTFIKTVNDNLPSADIFKDMGAGNIVPMELHQQLSKNFKLTDND
jgi:hypothetical protein